MSVSAVTRRRGGQKKTVSQVGKQTKKEDAADAVKNGRKRQMPQTRQNTDEKSRRRGQSKTKMKTGAGHFSKE